MTTDYKVTELFCVIDEFCKHFNAENDATQEIYYRSHQRHAKEHGTDCTLTPQICKQLYHEPYFCCLASRWLMYLFFTYNLSLFYPELGYVDIKNHRF